MTVSAVIVAAGKGTRMNHDIRKQYLLLAGRPILTHTLMVFEACEQIDQIVVVIPEDDFDFCQKTVINPLNLKEKICLVRGGTRRQDSVYNGLASLDPKTEIVVIHDGVRPFVTVENLSDCILAARATGACILGIPAGDTVKRVNQYGIVEATLARDEIWLAQTPQAFAYDVILKAHATARKAGYSGTDDALLVERLGIDVKVITGSPKNIKITSPEDLILAQAILAKR